MPEVNAEHHSARAECRQFDLDLPAYLEGEDRPGIARHAGECAFCRVVLADLELIRSQSSHVLLEDPPARVWANIRATLAAEGVFREPAIGWLGWLPQFGLWRYTAPLGALACLALTAAILLVPPTPAPPPASDEPPGLTAMEKSYQEREINLDPAARASYGKGLKSLDDSIRECKESVRKEPANTLAREYLDTAYEQKAAVLSAALEYDGR
jgi:hypothetical protein